MQDTRHRFCISRSRTPLHHILIRKTPAEIKCKIILLFGFTNDITQTRAHGRCQKRRCCGTEVRCKGQRRGQHGRIAITHFPRKKIPYKMRRIKKIPRHAARIIDAAGIRRTQRPAVNVEKRNRFLHFARKQDDFGGIFYKGRSARKKSGAERKRKIIRIIIAAYIWQKAR